VKEEIVPELKREEIVPELKSSIYILRFKITCYPLARTLENQFIFPFNLFPRTNVDLG